MKRLLPFLFCIISFNSFSQKSSVTCHYNWQIIDNSRLSINIELFNKTKKTIKHRANQEKDISKLNGWSISLVKIKSEKDTIRYYYVPKLNYKESYPNKSDYQGINPNSAKKISLILGLGFFIDEHENNFLDLQNSDSTQVLLFYSDNRKGGRNFMSSQECSCSN